MNKIKKWFKSNKFVTFLLATLIGLTAIIGVTALVKVNNMQGTKQLTSINFEISDISTTTGKLVDSHQHIAMKEMKSVEDMEIKLSEDATISYKVVFYDEDKDFVSASTAQTDDFDIDDVPDTAEYFRVVITPATVDGEAVTINVFTMNNYVNQISIRIAK